MSLPIHIVGIGADGREGLSARARQVLESATFVAGGKRHLALVAPPGVTTFAITNNLQALAERLRERAPEERCVVLASGDPLCFGVGVFLHANLPTDELVIEPAVSSMQLAFARAARPWERAAIGSVHGRPLASNLIPLLGRTTIGLFTHDGRSPAAIAEFFLERDLDDYTVWVCEELGSPDERVSRWAIGDLPGRTFRDLNVVLMERHIDDEAGSGMRRLLVPPDELFAQPKSGPVLLTHADVRAAALSRFDDLPHGPIWDIGAGLGGMAVGLSRMAPEVDVVAVERSAVQLDYLRKNRRQFAAWNMRIVHGIAPEVLTGEPAPSGVFLGGSGGELDGILGAVVDRLLPGGVLVANFVGLESLTRTMDRLRGAGWKVRVSHVQVSHSEMLAGLTTLVPQRPVWIVRAARA